MPKVSVLMNCYNGEKYLNEAIKSIYNQTFSNWEIIFIDNCSTDSTKKIVDNYDEKIKYYKTEKKISLGAARKYGLTLCMGDYIAFLDTDDLWMEDKLSLQIDLLSQNEDYAYCYTDYEMINENSDHLSYYKTKNGNGYIFKDLLKWYDVGMPTVVIRKDILDSLNEGFDGTLTFCPDYDLFMRIAINHKVCSIKKNLAKYRKVTNSLTNQTVDVHLKEIKYVEKKILNLLPNLENLFPKEYNHWQFWISKVEADFYIRNSDLRLARIHLLKASSLGERHNKRYKISLQNNGLKLLQDELNKKR